MTFKMFGLISSGLCLKGIINLGRNIHTGCVSFVQVTPILYAEPLKKKKKLDPQIIKQREDRKKRKLEKQIRRLEKNARQLKPVEELEVPLSVMDEKRTRARSVVVLSAQMLEQRILMLKNWSRFKYKQKILSYQIIDRLVQSAQKSLEELRKESEELYQEAIQVDLNLMPFERIGPINTPKIENYDSPDGEFIDISKKWH